MQDIRCQKAIRCRPKRSTDVSDWRVQIACLKCTFRAVLACTVWDLIDRFFFSVSIHTSTIPIMFDGLHIIKQAKELWRASRKSRPAERPRHHPLVYRNSLVQTLSPNLFVLITNGWYIIMLKCNREVSRGTQNIWNNKVQTISPMLEQCSLCLLWRWDIKWHCRGHAGDL